MEDSARFVLIPRVVRVNIGATPCVHAVFCLLGTEHRLARSTVLRLVGTMDSRIHNPTQAHTHRRLIRTSAVALEVWVRRQAEG